MIKLRSPKYEQAELILPQNMAQLNVSLNGELCSSNGECFQIQKNILDLLGKEPDGLTMAEYSNHFGITASAYEDLWRTKSLSILTGHDFPIEREIRYLNDWLDPKPNHLILDLGCSTALYARELKKKNASIDVVALDFSTPMLEEARKRALADETEVFLVRANAKKLPFFNEQLDAIACGGTLNELSDPRKVLYECRRSLKDEGKFFLMHLLVAETWYGKALQLSAQAGGIQFWTKPKVNELFESSGFKISKQHTEGIVCFTLLEAN